MHKSILVLAVALTTLSPLPAAAQSVGMEESLSAVEQSRVALAPLRLAQRTSATPIALAAAIEAVPGELADLAEWNRERREPARIGFARPLPETLQVDLAAAAAEPSLPAGEAMPHAGGLLARTAAGELVWGARIEVADAHRLRLHLTEVALPPGTEMWIYGGENEMVAFGLELLSEEERSLWTPSVGGGVIHLEVRAPAGAEGGAAGGSFAVAEVAEIFRLDGEGRPLVGVTPLPSHDLSCLVDAQCIGPGTFDVIEGVQRSIAHLQFMVGPAVGICTGGLVNDTAPATTIPFLQTANHCFSTQTVASTVEAFWDYFTPNCGGNFPNLGSLPRSSGATLLATGQSSDFTLVQLNSIPPNRALLGWNADPLAVPHGTALHRVHHPLGFAQAYSRSAVTTTSPTCSALPRPKFLYQNTTQGGNQPGSSGAPVILAGGQMVGQLLGVCGPNPSEGCDPANRVVDGAFSESFPSEVPFLTGAGFTPCVPSPTSLCLHNNRFRVEVDWQSGANQGDGVILSKLSDASGVFYFFNPNNAEMLVKVLNACVAPFNRYWVFYAATTNVEFTVTVTDTQADVTKSFYNSPNRAALPIQDTEAFATCP